MSTMKLFCLCTVILLFAVSGSQVAAMDPLSKTNRLPPSLEKTVQVFQSKVIKKGYEVARGYWTLWSADDCRLPLQTVGFCYGNNPTAPYVLAIVPPWKDEYVDQSMQHALIQGHKGMIPNYRLGEGKRWWSLPSFLRRPGTSGSGRMSSPGRPRSTQMTRSM